jgi:hypothetical protein
MKIVADTHWVEEAKRLFQTPRPEHFTDFEHCCECQEHDDTLRSTDIDTIGLEELGNPGWDPMCFATPEATHYYLPALIRLSLDTMNDEFYLAQFLFHLQWDGPGNKLFQSCNVEQRAYLAGFIAYAVERYPDELEAAYCADDALSVLQIWSAS